MTTWRSPVLSVAMGLPAIAAAIALTWLLPVDDWWKSLIGSIAAGVAAILAALTAQTIDYRRDERLHRQRMVREWDAWEDRP